MFLGKSPPYTEKNFINVRKSTKHLNLDFRNIPISTFPYLLWSARLMARKIYVKLSDFARENAGKNMLIKHPANVCFSLDRIDNF